MMVFNSLEFALFLPVVLLLYAFVYQKEQARDVFLLAASYFFYMSWEWQYAGLILLSTVVDYFLGLAFEHKRFAHRKKLLVTISLLVNLGVLALFKYFNFFAFNLNTLMAWYSGATPISFHELLLPVGISFYTFQTLSYTIDLYRGAIPAERNFIKFAVFVSFFPQLVAGPIVRAKDFLPQLYKKIRFERENFEFGLQLVFIGLLKKIVIADLLAYLIVDSVFENPGQYSSVELMVALYAYAFQIYCDFSGYSDIAIGVACMLGFTLPINFNRPYLSQTPSEFWTRWHISLSSWLRDYLYISLGGNRLGKLFTIRNLFLTMVLGGLWHGAAWTFILWGAYHGLILSLTRGVQPEQRFNGKMVLKILIMFHATLLGWLIFRIDSLENLGVYLGGIADLSSGFDFSPIVLMILALASLMHIVPQDFSRSVLNWVDLRLPVLIKSGIYAGAIFIFYGLSLEETTFIYFQF
ncbi:MBOAT family protein [Exilibacterium tricleocarpae]|uniref:Probable alginate O-acetylase n=1 Tax=Exilibacterium tricleocarpae TaxID=2591008 RepID=A0A545T3F2_9GAMM|nr:MBOAT family O-acyltransferase [Exilibacterium tricleocarpae]TQV71751.1 MBOAT family protein [Exilibacterium tricleocarpae]